MIDKTLDQGDSRDVKCWRDTRKQKEGLAAAAMVLRVTGMVTPKQGATAEAKGHLNE